MTPVRVLAQMARADLLERTRRYSFFVMLAACVYAGHGFLPPNPGPYATMQFGGHRGIYNSAWVGTVVALLCGVFLSLFGFYLIRNAVERDRQTRVGEILATTPLGKVQYTVGKMLSNFAVLATMTVVVAVAAGIVQVVRGEHTAIDPWALGAPFLFLTLPVMLLTSAVAVFFEVTPGLRGGFGNVAYYFVWTLALVMAVTASDNRLRESQDLLGTGLIIPSMARACQAAFPDYDVVNGSMSIGLNFRPQGWSLSTFTWEGVRWTPGSLAPRLVWVVLAFGIAAAAAIPFDRFDPARARMTGATSEKRRRRGRVRDADTDSEGVDAVPDAGAGIASSPVPAHVRPLAPDALGGSGLSRFAACVSAELKLALRGTSRWWYVPWIIMAAFTIALPLETAGLRVLPLLWIWPVLKWSPLGTRERRHGVDQILFSAPHPIGTQLAALWASGLIIAVAAGAPIAVRLAIAGDGAGLLAWLVGAAFIPALALALGIWTGTPRTFEAAYTMLWYAGPLQPLWPLDFMGASHAAIERGMPAVYLAITAVLLAVATLGRRRQVRG